MALLIALASGCTQASDATGVAPASASESTTGADSAQPEAAAATPPMNPSEQMAQAAQTGQAIGDPELNDRYPSLRFGLLPAEFQRSFMSVAQGELCPCDGVVASLDDCLQAEDACELSVQVASLVLQLVVEQANPVAISDAVQQHVDNSRRVHSFMLDDTPYHGAAEPEVVIVEFSDFECPHCARLAERWGPLLEDYGDRVRVYHKQFPLSSHPNAAAASAAALAADRQGQFIAYKNLVFSHQTVLQQATNPRPLFLQWAEELGLNMARFEADMADSALATQIARDRQEGIGAGIQSTPTIYINGVMQLGSYEDDALRARVDAALAAE
ncbi:MAG: protein-disulfide isomerase [Bradymonadia bacterium]